MSMLAPILKTLMVVTHTVQKASHHGDHLKTNNTEGLRIGKVKIQQSDFLPVNRTMIELEVAQ